MKKALLNSIVFLFSIICFSQTIELVRFDNTKTYNPGSGVSMHINPTGIFILDDTSNLSANTNNTFILELSTAGGSFTTATNLGTVDDFYTPLMNGVIPTGTASGEYKLRVRSTNPVTSVESGTFTIDSSTTSALPTATSNIAINTNYFECLNDGANTVNPYFGSLKQAYDATVADMPSAYRFLQIAASNSSNTLNVNLIDIGAGTTTAITATSPGVYAIPDTLEVGTYNIEVEEVDSSGNSSFFSFTFLFHTSATTFGTPGVDIVCTNTEVEFNVDISILGIGRNYMGSYYTFDWGDGTAVEVLTHAELIQAYTAPLDLISHTFVLPSCTSGGGSSFEVKMDLYNKGLSVNGTDPSCDEYIANGTGASKEIITSDAPQANFTLADEQCITENIVATNTTINGSFPVSDGSCSGEPTFTWYYKPPTASDFIPVFSGSPWLVGNDLIIPSDDITVPGCWTIKLSAVNPDYCQIEDIHEDIINIEAEPDADFDIIELGSIVQDLNIQESSSSSGTGFYTSGNTYTAGQTGKLTSVSMYKNSICDVSGGFSPTLKIYQGQVAFNNAGYVVGSPPLLYQKSFTGSYWNSSNSAYNSTYGIISGWFKMAIPIEDAPTLNSGTQYTILMTGTSCNQFIANLDPSNTDVTFVGSGASQYAIDNYVLRMITTMLVDPPSGQNSEVSQICVDDVVTLTDASNIVSSDCESELPNEDPAYQWTISPNSGYTLINSTTLTSQSPQVEFNSVGNYTITQTVTTECGSDSFSSDLEVIGNPTVSFPQDSQTYCSTSTLLIDFANQLTPTYSTGLNAPTSYTWTVTGDGIDSNDYSFASSTTASDALPTIQLNSYGTYNITVTLGSNCGTDASDTISVTLSQTPIITNTDTSQEVCSGDSSASFTAISDVNDTTFSWVVTENSNLSGYISSGTGATISAQTITNNTNINQNLIYSITPVSGGCAGNPYNYTITVNPKPLILDKTETICDADTFSITPVDNSPTEIVPVGTTYSWGTPVSDPVGAITGGSALTEQTSISQTLTNTTTAPATLTYSVQADSNGCKSDTFDVVITVNPNGQINAIADQTLCDGNSTLEVNFGNSNTGAGTVTYNWTNDNIDIGLAASGTGDIASFTASNDTTAQITGTITATATYTYNDISCEGESQSFTITVNPSPQVDFSQTDQVIVSGETTTAVDLTSPTEDVVFSWTVSVPTGISGVTTTSGTDNIPAETMVNLTTEPLTVVYTAVATGDVGFDCGGLDTLYNVTVNPLAMVNPVNDQIVCNGDNVLVEFSSALSGGSITYSWTNDNSNIGLSNAGTGNIDIIATNTSNQPITGNIVVTPSFENGGNTNIGDPITFTITVNPTGQVSVSDAIQVLSNGFDTNQIAFSTSNIGGTTTYNWTNSDTSIGLAASGSGNINAFTAINTGTSPVTSNLNVIGTFENNGVSCVGPSVPFEITVNPTAQVDQTNDIVVSNGDNVNVPFTTVNTGGTSTYNWTNSDPTIGLADSGSGNIVFTAVNTGTSPITTTVVVTPTFENDGDSNSGPSDTFTITINPTAQVNTINGIVLCNGDNTSTFTFTTENTGGTTTYNWTNDNTSIGLASSGSDSINSFAVVNSTTTAQVATIIVTPTFENGGNSNTGPSETFTITVNPTAQINVINSIINCAGSDSGDIIFTTQNTDGNTTYSWTNDNTDIGLADSGSGNISSFILTNSSTETQIANIVVTPTYTNNGVSCSGADETFTITIPMGQVNPIEDIELCDDDPIAEVIFTTENTIGTTTYDWINDNTSIGLADSGTGNISSFAVINNSDVAQSANITVTPSYNYNGVVCTGPAETFLITINPSAQVDPVASQILCNGDVSNEIIFTTINTDGITTYNWTNDNTTIGLSESGTGDIPAFDVVNTSNNVQISNIIVTPVYDNNGVVCSGPTESFTITVNPSAQINSLETFNTVICYGEFTPVYTFTTSNVDGLTTFNWTNDNASIGLAESGSGGGIPSFQATNSTTSTIFSTITVTPSYDNNGIVCDGASETFTITVNPSPNVDEIDDITLCNNQESSIISFSTQNTDGNTTYTWTNSNTIIGLDASGEGDIPSFIATNSSAVSESALITVTPVYENNGIVCLGIPEEFGITVLSEIVLSGTPVDADDCENPNSGSIDLLVSGGSGDYSFLWSNGETTEDLSNIPSGEYTVEVTDSEGCTAQSETFTIWRQDDLVVDLQTSFDPNCEGNFVSQINQISISGGVAPYTINWSSGSVSIDDNTIMTAYENGIYNVLVTDSFGCQVNTEIVVDFQEIGDPSFYYTSSGDIDCGISVFNELEFINTSSGDYINVTWDFGDGSEVVSGDIVTHQYLNSGEYTITQIVEYNYGCTEVNVQEIVITDGYNVILPTAFSPNGDGINDTIRPVYSCMNSIEMSIYDTFGSLIYYEDNLELQGWDGILKGKKAENGNYLLVVRAVSIYDEEINLKAVFVLIR